MTLRIAIVDGDPVPPGLDNGAVELARIGGARVVGDAAVPRIVTSGAALLGWAFHRDGANAYAALTPADVEAIVESTGTWAIENLWGSFLLVWGDRAGDVHILRSPVTGPPLFLAENDLLSQDSAHEPCAGHCAFTDLPLARSLGFRLDRLNPAAIDAQLRYPLLRPPATGIAGVREILPGEVASLAAPSRRIRGWLPWDFTLRPPRPATPEELRALVREVVCAWGSRFDRLQLELSGGIDSSIVAACLAGRSAPWQAVTMVTPGPDGDERIYSRPVAERMNAPLVELLHDAAPGDPLAPPARLRVRPGGFGLLTRNDAAFLASARAFQADAIFSGTGGDGIFGYHSSIAPALDALRFVGLRAGLSAAYDQATIMGDNLWSALKHAALGLLRGMRPWPVDHSFLSQRFAGVQPEHPWMAGMEKVAAGQRAYGMKLLIIQPFLDGYDRSSILPKIAPLLSQPLVEFGLGVPSWQWGEGGVNRALVRRAFQDDLPEIVLARRSKGRILSVFLPAFNESRARLRPYLLNGLLAGEGLLDIDTIDALLSGRTRADPLAMIRILHITDIELWARSIVGKMRQSECS